MGWAERMAREAESARAGKDPGPSLAPRPEIAGAAPSEWLEQMSRKFAADLVAQANAIEAAMQPRSALVGPDGNAPPKIDYDRATLASMVRLMRSMAILNDMFLTFLTGVPDIKPIPAQPENHGGQP